HAASETELRTVQESRTEAIQVFDAGGTLLSMDGGAERIFAVDESDWSPNGFDSRWELLRENGSPMPVDERPVAVAVRTGESSEGAVMGIRNRVDNRVKWLSVSTTPIRDPASRVTGWVCCSRDISERMQTIRELDVISHAAQLLSASLDPDDVVHALTTSAARLCSSPGELSRRAQLFVIQGATMTMTAEYDPDGEFKSDGATLAVADHPYIQQVLATGEATMAELDYDRCGTAIADLMRRSEIKNCAWVPLRSGERVVAVLAVAGRQHALINPAQLERLKTLTTIAELALSNAQAHQRAAELSLTDPLTGVANVRGLDRHLAHLPRSSFAIVAIDVDDLKKVNDAHGHAAGDQLLSGIAAALAREIRPSDLLARTGGDEFVAVLVDCDAKGAVALAERMTRAVARLTFAGGPPSISVGSAVGAPGDPPQAVLKAADDALYSAKGGFKGRAPAALGA
ncbi:MAG TPA: diguanylate cyclase, partial [Candidatus Deferrimicrobium sp.]|nr:diguanylate cyclase [Candidatus Deferrimicrobium sp.]